MKTGNKLPIEKQKEIANRLKALREHKQLTQAQAAKAIGVTVKTYREWEVGKYTKDNSVHYYPSMDVGSLYAMSELYGVSIDHLLCKSKFTSLENDFIGNYTGLSNTAITALHVLHTPIDQYTKDSTQISRYDIIALNLILENCYSEMEEQKDYKKFSQLTNSILHYIGSFIDSNSAKIGSELPMLNQNGSIDIFSPGEIAREINKTKLLNSLNMLYEKYSLEIVQRKEENKAYFEQIFLQSMKEYLHNQNNSSKDGD